jgi:hypothetical protein
MGKCSGEMDKRIPLNSLKGDFKPAAHSKLWFAIITFLKLPVVTIVQDMPSLFAAHATTAVQECPDAAYKPNPGSVTTAV